MFPSTDSKPQHQLSFYFNYGHPITKRTKRYMVRTAKKEGTEPVLPLLTLLLQIVRKFRAGEDVTGAEYVNKNHSSIFECSTPNLIVDDQKHPSSDQIGSSTFRGEQCFKTNRDSIYCGDIVSGLVSQREQGDLERLVKIIHERLPEKLRFVVRRLFHQYRDNLVFLFECPDILEFELKQVVSDSKDNRSTRRRRSRRGGKRAKRSKVFFNHI